MAMMLVRAEQGSGGRGLLNKEEKMRLITRFELVSKSETELRGLLREAFNALAASDVNSFERRNALASIENIQRELHLRQ